MTSALTLKRTRGVPEMYATTFRQKAIYNFLTEVSEDQLRRDIAVYEQALADIGPPATAHERGLENNYRTLLCYGRKLLAAIRDGRPDQWIDYPD